jgi:hypothetical protein
MKVSDLIVSEYTLVECDPVKGPAGSVTINRQRQRDDSYRWAVRAGGFCLNEHGAWEYEPIPSSRTDGFLRRCRFESVEAALSAWEKRKGDV